ncbi:alkanesulfonate monooxygenase [Candidatus Protofrankia californiensis]|uniref:Alkanesulfonate monooxygenase n=1 Tax=Candidatus Protofrankia californiensis TaxID=1839754 RepID=A0A1C3NZN9_9ACTN|nr:alkanesulfonate monooxygenase [Candidatus Protofrankia californiensis]
MIEFNWSLPMFDDDAGEPGTPPRRATLPYLTSIARSAQDVGFHALLLGAGYGQQVEAFTTAAALLQHADRIRALVAVRPGFYHPAIAAKLAATVDQHSGGRLLLNVVTGGVPSDLAKYGDRLPHDERYDRTREFLEVFTRLTAGTGPIDHDGRYFACEKAELDYGLVGHPHGRIYFGGLSEPAREVAAEHADTFLMWGFPAAEVSDIVEDMRRRALRHDRKLRFGVRINVIARATSEEAWAKAESLLVAAGGDPMCTVRQETDSMAQQRMFALGADGPDRNGAFWSGLSKLRVGSGTALVGSYREVADGLRRYVEAGVDAFILAAAPHLEECLRVGEQVLPALS